MLDSMNEELSIPKAIVNNRVARLRLLTGLLQGLMLYFLYWSLKNASWPATSAYIYAPLLLVSLFVPILFISGLGHLEPRRMWIWIVVSTLIAVVLADYDIWRLGYMDDGNWFGLAEGRLRVTPSALVLFFTAVGFYIAHALVLAAAADHRRIARYPSYFELAWKLIIQIMFSLLFVGVLWLILWMGAALFMLVKFSFLYDLLRTSWFAIWVTAFAFSTALHITDVRPGIVRGIRGLLLVLMSWLLPITTLLVGGFLIILPFAGLEPLWATRHATSLLLGTVAILVLLINATFQGGDVGDEVARVLRGSARIACALLLPLTMIAVYALSLRVQQYGWSSDRIIAAACLLIAACYASGYLWASLERKKWLERIAPVNVLTAMLILIVLLGLFTPLADPARLSVSDQLNRLASGKVSAEKFDYDYLRFEGARYGNEALQQFKLATGTDAAVLNKHAQATLQKKNKWDRKNQVPADASARVANITLWPQGQTLPAGFIDQDWAEFKDNYAFPQCLVQQDAKCDAYLVDFNADGKTEILLKNAKNYDQGLVFGLGADGKWSPQGKVSGLDSKCEEWSQALSSGNYRLVDPRFKDVQIAGQSLHVEPWPAAKTVCSSSKK